MRTNGALSAVLHIHRFITIRVTAGYTYRDTFDAKKIRDTIQDFTCRPLVSIIMPVYNVDRKWLVSAIESLRCQFYENWELCAVDDGSTKGHVRKTLTRYARKDKRIKVRFLVENTGIAGASNEALSIASGDFVGFLDHDDELTPDALYESVKAINETGRDLYYSDEDHITRNNEYATPYFKPDYSPDFILSKDYITHFIVCRKSVIDKIGGFRKGFDGAQDHELLLRILEGTDTAHHIPKVLYHWREHPGSVAASPDAKPYAWEAGRRAVEAALERRNIRGEVSLGKEPGIYRVRRHVTGNPLVSIVIPFRDKPGYLKGCLDSVLERSSYARYEIIGIDNGSSLGETRDLIDSYRKMDGRIRFLEYDVPFNYSRINNYGVNQARGTHIVLMNNDIEIITHDWIEALLEHTQRPEVGAVGAKLYYPDNTIQHAGVVIGYGTCGAAHSFYRDRRDTGGYFGNINCIHNVSAVTGALMMVRKEVYEGSEGLNETDFPVAFNDIDFCLRLISKGLLNVFTPYCEAYHHESISRGYDDVPRNQERLEREAEAFRKIHREILGRGDPYYNPNLTLTGKLWDMKWGIDEQPLP